MPWVLLVFAGLFEIGWAIGLKYTEGFTRLWPSVGTVASMAISVGLLGLAMKTLPVVMLTSSREEADVIASYDLGVNAYVVKPVGFGDFMDALRQLGAFWAVLNEVPHASPGSPVVDG